MPPLTGNQETSFIDDGFSTLRFQNVECKKLKGRLWSDGEELWLRKLTAWDTASRSLVAIWDLMESHSTNNL